MKKIEVYVSDLEVVDLLDTLEKDFDATVFLYDVSKVQEGTSVSLFEDEEEVVEQDLYDEAVKYTCNKLFNGMCGITSSYYDKAIELGVGILVTLLGTTQTRYYSLQDLKDPVSVKETTNSSNGATFHIYNFKWD